MTQRNLLYVLLPLALFLNSLSAVAQLRLSEPKSSQEDSDPDRPAKDLPTSSRLRKSSSVKPKPKSLPRGVDAESSETQDSPTKPSTTKTRPSAIEKQSVISLIAHDTQPEAFFSGPVPRTIAIGEDATLNDVCHVGTLCWAVGERGVVCSSTDGGLTWTTQFAPMDCSLRSVCFLTNKIGWIAGFRILPGTSQQSAVLLNTRDGGVTWTDLAASPSEPNGSQSLATSSLPGFLKIQFFGLENAVAVTMPVTRRGGEGVFRTDDGGQTWTAIPTDQPGSVWTDGLFLSESEGIVVGRHQSYATVVSDQTVIINPPQPTLRQMRGISLDSSGQGWMVGDGTTILRTENSGVTWEAPVGEVSRSILELTDLHTVAHKDGTVLLGGNPGSILLRSETAGENWNVVPIPASGVIHRIHFLSETEVLALGSFGQVLSSADAGNSWTVVRSADFRSGVLNLVTDADKASWQLLSDNSGENGVRSVVLQMSQPLNIAATSSVADRAMTTERTQLAISQLGGNESVADWMLPRTKPEHHRSAEQLLAEWNRQTDGQLQRLLPLRLARDLRNWKPSVVVIESASDDDAVAVILRDAILRAIEMAGSDDEGLEAFSSIALTPWNVDRVLVRVSSGNQASLSFDDSDLLPSLKTTTGLICDAVSSVFENDLQSARVLRTRAGYEVLMDRNDATGFKDLLDGIDRLELKNAVRPATTQSRDETQALQEILQTAHIESTAAQGSSKLNRAEEALTAELQNIGQALPDALAAKQLRDLASLNLQQNNMEGYLAVQQEIARRYPNSEDGRKAAEMLFLFYSSAEARYFRLRSTSKSPFGMAAHPVTPDALQDDNLPASGEIVQPKFQKPESQTFSATASNPTDALQERWNSHAATALRILLTSSASEKTHREISPLVQLRHAANQRVQNRSGEQTNALSDLSQRDDEYAVFANCEMQLNAAAIPGLPLYNLPRRSEPPFLDGQLTDSIWENAEEISLQTFQRSGLSDAETGANGLRPSNPETTNSLVMLAWDEEFLYFAARFDRAVESPGVVQQATHRSHDAKHQNRDRLEFEIDTDRDFMTAFQLSVDESGLTSDRCWMLDRWNPKWFVAVDSDESVWRVEAAIPFSELASAPAKPGDLWSVKLRRILPGVMEHELVGPSATVSTHGTAFVRFIRPKVVTSSRRK